MLPHLTPSTFASSLFQCALELFLSSRNRFHPGQPRDLKTSLIAFLQRLRAQLHCFSYCNKLDVMEIPHRWILALIYPIRVGREIILLSLNITEKLVFSLLVCAEHWKSQTVTSQTPMHFWNNLKIFSLDKTTANTSLFLLALPNISKLGLKK